MENKSINLFYRSNLLCFYLKNFFCKIDLGLDTISFLERLLKVCDSQNSQFFDPSSSVLYILYNCEWVWTNFLLYLFWNILYIPFISVYQSRGAGLEPRTAIEGSFSAWGGLGKLDRGLGRGEPFFPDSDSDSDSDETFQISRKLSRIHVESLVSSIHSLGYLTLMRCYSY
jgi:hypothetical protein